MAPQALLSTLVGSALSGLSLVPDLTLSILEWLWRVLLFCFPLKYEEVTLLVTVGV